MNQSKESNQSFVQQKHVDDKKDSGKTHLRVFGWIGNKIESVADKLTGKVTPKAEILKDKVGDGDSRKASVTSETIREVKPGTVVSDGVQSRRMSGDCNRDWVTHSRKLPKK